jgi:hypothetical protein
MVTDANDIFLLAYRVGTTTNENQTVAAKPPNVRK